MKLISDIPCKNCITFAICNAQISEHTPYSDIACYLIPKCSLIKEYIQPYKSLPSRVRVISKLVKFFKPNSKKELNICQKSLVKIV